MTQAIDRDQIYRGRRFKTETIELCVRWYITSDRCCAPIAVWMPRRSSSARPWPPIDRDGHSKINLDGNAASHRALRMLGNEDPRWKSLEVRYCRYLNNVVEQDPRTIKRRCASMLGLKSFDNAAITFAGIELINRIRKGQFSFVPKSRSKHWSLDKLWERALQRDVAAQNRECTRTQELKCC